MTAAPEAIDQLVSILNAGLPGDVRVFDGPVVTGAEPTKRLYVGYDGDPDGEWTAVTTDQTWAGTLGAGKREEGLSVVCSIIARNGSGNVKNARDDADAVFEEVSTLLRANVRLGFGPPATAQLRNPLLSYFYDPNTGVEARIRFEVEVSRVRF